jgi:acyl carrier protein
VASVQLFAWEMSLQDRLSRFLTGVRWRAKGRKVEVVAQSGVKARIVTIVRDVLRQRLPAVQLNDGVTFDGLGVNPLERIYIADDIEREWQIVLDEDDIDAWDSVIDIAHAVRLQLEPRLQEQANLRTGMKQRFHPISDEIFDDLIQAMRRA